jgi:uncharacterized protein YprB with RNaseH-like and TPR domain/predicted RNA-binding Zn-ribbon protein involved in translation (DUF1610 family)
MVKEKEGVKILFFDIETTPNVVYTWGRYEQDAIDVVDDWHLLCFAYKWFGEKETFAMNGKEENMVKYLWQLFNEADVIVAHNGDQFDIKKVNALFIKYGMKPPAPYKTIDTKKVAKRYFRFDSNKLDDLGRYLGLGRKMQTGGFELWKGCMDGDKKAWKIMLDYNKQDVILLEKVYLKMRSWITNHPNLNLFNNEDHVCPNCGSNKIQKRGFSVSRTGKYQRHACQDCGAWSIGEKVGETVRIK